MPVATFGVGENVDALARVDAHQAQLVRATPIWAWAAFGLAVFGGFLGSIALLLRRKVAVVFYAVALVATLIQYGHSLLFTDIVAAKGVSQIVGPAFDVALGVAQLLYGRLAQTKGWMR